MGLKLSEISECRFRRQDKTQ